MPERLRLAQAHVTAALGLRHAGWCVLRNPHGHIDGSAVYGVLVHAGSPAVHDFRDVCCAAQRKDAFDRVRIQNLVVSSIDYECTEVVVGVDAKDRPIADSSGAVKNAVASDVLRQLQGPGCPLAAVQNCDIMAHTCKGIVAVRIEHGRHASLCGITVRCLRNYSQRTAAPAYPNINDNNTTADKAMRHIFGATYTRGIVLASVENATVDCVTIDDLHSAHGPVKGLELMACQHACVRALRLRALSGPYACGCYVQRSCSDVQLQQLEMTDSHTTDEKGQDPQVLATEAGAAAVCSFVGSAKKNLDYH